MRFKGRALMKSDPDFELETLLAPMTFQASLGGSFTGTTGEVRARVGRIPITVAIPFRKGRRQVVVASIGGFSVALKPLTIRIEECRIEAAGVLGSEKGIRASAKGKVGCETEMAGEGQIWGEAARVTLELGDEHSDDGGRDEPRPHAGRTRRRKGDDDATAGGRRSKT